MRCKLILAGLLAAAALGASSAQAQPSYTNRSGVTVPADVNASIDWNGVQRKDWDNQLLATLNTPLPPVTLYGGTYVLSQTCTTYGTVVIQKRGPDGVYRAAITKTSADTTDSTITVAGGAQVQAVLTGTAGCTISIGKSPP